MSTNIEIKATCDDPQRCQQACLALGARLAWSLGQTDTYFRVPTGRLKVRRNDDGAAWLIQYERADSPLLRESRFVSVSLRDAAEGVGDALTRALGVAVEVRKHRSRYELGDAIVNLDEVDGLGAFVEVEVRSDLSRSRAAAEDEAQRLLGALGVTGADAVPWSYSDLLVMHRAAASWRGKLAAAGMTARLFLLDGASCSGKTTVLQRLVDDPSLGLVLVPRHSTREPRPGEERGSEYRFVGRDAFNRMAREGEFLEYRDFEFGMSYGLAWTEVAAPLLRGRCAIGIMNLGNIRLVKRLMPEALTILVAAAEETIRRRLVERGLNRPEQIEERLGNARRVAALRPYYDLAVDNDDGRLEEAIGRIRQVIASASAPANGPTRR